MIMKVLKKITFAFVLLYSFNLISSKFGIVIPINAITMFLVTLFDIPAMILLFFSLIIIF